ncbi:AEC family transporter [Williamsoniiplasma luminosum]|uniref:Malate permease n=1 Tax=Williamsoniiplasma luminosum TaxID=214888 RepID=A0A2S0NJT1_9MOLU|nr:AEC family transporter [Williamsoniiplasma luminosum]AVP49267.1 MAG: hypothetical protein C5T88_01570 [Williamsoniiplasma luminosum]
MNFQKLIEATFQNFAFWSVLLAAIVIIGVGYFIEKKKIIASGWEKVLSRIDLVIAIPALALNSFMVDTKGIEIGEILIIILIGFVFYVPMTFLAKYFFLKSNMSRTLSLSMVVVLPAGLFFGFPILNAAFSSAQDQKVIGIITSVFQISFWIFLATAAQHFFQKPIVEKTDNLAVAHERKYKFTWNWKSIKPFISNPVLGASLIGFTLWIFQLIPGIDFVPSLADPNKYVSITRFDQYIPGFDKILKLISALAAPLAWLAIGVTIGKVVWKVALKQKIVWYAVGLKNILVPFIFFLITAFFAWIGKASGGYRITIMSYMAIMSIIASPTATALVSYAILNKREPELVSQSISFSILFSFISLPLWMVFGTSLALEMNVFLA